jgi:S-(hydroxymethyl)glutathione dehydrogenase/alcohol dehydrogenase
VRFSHEGEPVHHCHGVSSFTEFTLVTEEVAIGVTDRIPIEHASLLGCGIFTGVGAVTSTVDVELGSTVAVFGCGGVGLSAVQAARIRGADEVIAVDVVPEKLTLAERVGATTTVDSSAVADPVEAVRAAAGGGVEYAFEVVGNVGVLEQAVATLAPTGTAVLVGVPPKGTHEVGLDVFDLVTGERRIVGSFNGTYDLPTAIPRLARLVVDGRFEVDPLITGRRPLAEVNEAMEELETGTGIRQLIVP